MWVNFHIHPLVRRDHCGAELFMERRSLSIFIVRRCSSQCVCVCAIKKLNRNRRQHFFPSNSSVVVTVVDHAMSNKKKWKSVKTEPVSARMPRKNYLLCTRERVGARAAADWKAHDAQNNRNLGKIMEVKNGAR